MKAESNHGIYPITAFRIVGLVIGFLSCGKPLRYGICSLAIVVMLSGYTIPTV